MSLYINQYEDALSRAEDYDYLSTQIENICSDNLFNHLFIKIKEVADKLNLNTPYSNYMITLLTMMRNKSCNENALRLLIDISDKISRNIENQLIKLDERLLYIVFICATDKTFMFKVPEDNLKQLIVLIRSRLLSLDKPRYDIIDKILIYYLIGMIDGKTIDELNYKYKKLYETVTDDEIQLIINPMIAMFNTFITNQYQCESLYQLFQLLQIDKIESDISMKAINLFKNFKNKGILKNATFNDVWYIYKDFTLIFSQFNDEFIYDDSKCYIDNFKENIAVGNFLRSVLQSIQYAYDSISNPKIIACILNESWRIVSDNNIINTGVRWMVNKLLDAYLNSNEYEDVFYKGDIYISMKNSLDHDPSFKVLTEEVNYYINKEYFNDAYRLYFAGITNPFHDIELEKIENSIYNIANEATAKRTEQWDPDEDIQDSNDDNQKDDTEKNNDEEETADKPYDGPEIEASQSNKGYKKSSKKVADVQNAIYKSYKKYKNAESKVDSQLTKMLNSAKRAFSQDKTEEIIEGKKYTPIGLLKRILTTAAIFSYSKIAGFVYLLVKHTLSKKRTDRQRKEILLQIDTEIKMLEEKIEDARADGNRDAKYALMRTKAELERARDKIKYGLAATKEDMKAAKTVVS